MIHLGVLAARALSRFVFRQAYYLRTVALDRGPYVAGHDLSVGAQQRVPASFSLFYS